MWSRRRGRSLRASEGRRKHPGWKVASSSSERLDSLRVFRLQVSPRHFQIVVALQVHPKLRAVAEIQTQAKRGIGSDTPPIVDDLGDTIGRNADGLGKLVL